MLTRLAASDRVIFCEMFSSMNLQTLLILLDFEWWISFS
jgi:hypothetical protein